jgi:hypothetical protein
LAAAQKWVRKHGCPWNTAKVATAAFGGFADVLNWIREEVEWTYIAPWKDNISSEPALGGHLDVLKWLKEEGCIFNEDTWESAAFYDHVEVLKWLKEEGCPMGH